MATERLPLDRAAEKSGLPVETLRGLILRGQLKAERDPESGALLVEWDELRRYVES